MPIEERTVESMPGGRMTPSNAADYVGRSTKTLSNWRHQGIGPPYHKAGGRVFYLVSEIDEWLQSGKVEANHET